MHRKSLAAIFGLMLISACGLTPPPSAVAGRPLQRSVALESKRPAPTLYGVTLCVEGLERGDRDKNGLLSERELYLKYTSVPMSEDPPPGWDEEMKQAAHNDLRKLDLDRNGGLDIVEYLPTYWNTQPPAVRKGTQPLRLMAAVKAVVKRFKALDDGSEFLTQKEYLRGASNPEQARRQFAWLDKDEDQVLYLGELFADFPEFVR